ncbi:MAG TPA: porin PorA family protein [Candidatus Anoxymicrobiaceae bacterium]
MMSFVSRWKAIKRQRSNSALVIAGCALILLAFAWRLAIAPALKVVPTNIDELLYLNGTITNFVNPPGQPATGSAQPAQVQVQLNRRVFSRPLDSTTNTAIVKTEDNVFTRDPRTLLSTTGSVYAIDRRTGAMVSNKRADQRRSGYLLVFPFNSPASSVPLWSELTGRTYPAKYVKSEKFNGIEVYDYQMAYGNQPLAKPPAGYPYTLTGAQARQILSTAVPVLADNQTVKPIYAGSSVVAMKVEPKSGTIVSIDRFEESVSITINGLGTNVLALTQALNSVAYSQLPQSSAAVTVHAKDQLAKFRLQFVYIPLGMLVLGFAVLLAGLFAGVKPGVEGTIV